MKKDRDVIVFLEPFVEEGEDINRGLLTEGARIARYLGGNLCAMTVGASGLSTTFLEEQGVSVLYEVTGSCLTHYDCEAFAWAAKTALAGVPLRLLCFAQTDRGSELAPRVASYLGTSAVMDCDDILFKRKGLVYVRSVYGGQFEQEISYRGPYHEVAAMKPEAMNTGRAVVATTLCTIQIPVGTPPVVTGAETLERILPDRRTIDIRYAKRVVGVGSGCLEVLSRAEELSDLLDGVIATTRPVVDDGHLPKKRMIGQTGKTVSPDLYLALGISGSQHHVAGIQKVKEILSINRDPRAPVFTFSDVGFVADLNTLLPKLIDRIKRYRDEGIAS